MIQNNYFTNNEDLMLQFNEVIEWDEIVKAYEGNFEDAENYKKTGNERLSFAPTNVSEAIDYYRSTLESLGDLSGKDVAAKSQEMFNEGLELKDGKVIFPKAMVECMNKLIGAGLHSFGLSRHYGGLSLPLMAQAFAMEVMSRADAAFYIAVSCLNLGETIEKYGTKEMKEQWVSKMAEGTVMGAMALTEPNYGSDLPAVQTKAVKGEDGVWRLNGTKRFITHACGFEGIPSVILTLARTGNPTSGARGLSFFLVEGKDIQVAGIEKKMGLHCSPTCEIVYENSPGILIGDEGAGLIKYAMGMMNNARMSIAGQSLGIATAAYAEAKKYASEREQFGKTIENIPAVKRLLERMDREILGMRVLLHEAARTVDRYLWKVERMQDQGKDEKEIRKDEEIRYWEKLANFFTPLSKYYLSEGCNKISYDGLQIFGGAGYTEDYDAARIYRDARITNIYEGTTQLQVVAAIGGIVSGMMPNGQLRSYIEGEIKKFQPSQELQAVRELFEKNVNAYKQIQSSEKKDMYALEVVDSASRFLMGMLLERSIKRMKSDTKSRISKTKEFNLESLSILQGYQVRLTQNF